MILVGQTHAQASGHSSLIILLAILALASIFVGFFYFGVAQAVLGTFARWLRGVSRWGFETWRRWLSWANAGVLTGLVVALIVMGVRVADDLPYLSILLGLVTVSIGVVTCLAYVYLDVERDEVERGYKALHNPMKGQEPARDLAAYGSRVGLFLLIGAAVSAIGGFALLNLGLYDSFGASWYLMEEGHAVFSDFLVYSIINLYRVVDLLELANHHRIVRLAHVQPNYWPVGLLLNLFKTFFTFVILQQIVVAIRKGKMLHGTIADFFNPHQVIHDRACDGLAKFGVGAIKPLFHHIRRGSPLTKEHREHLVEQIAKMGPAAVTTLSKRVRDPHEQVRALSVEALGRLHAVQVVAAFAPLGQDASDLVRLSRVCALGEFLELGVRELRKRKSLFLAWQSAPWRLHGWRARLKLSRDDDPVARIAEQLRESLNDAVPEIRTRAALHMANLGTESRAAVDDVSRLLDDADDQVRQQAATTLGKMGPHSPATLAALVRRLVDPSAGVRAAAVEAIGADAAAASAMPEFVSLLNDHDETVRAKVAQVLGSAEALHGDAVDRLTRDLKSPDALVRARTAEALGNIGPASRALAPALVEAAHDENDRVRAKAIKALGKIGEAAAVAALPKLVFALRDPDPWVSSLAAEALGEMGDAADRAAPALVRSLAHPNLQVRMQAVEALGKLGPAAQTAIPALENLVRDEDAALRSLAVATLGILGVRPRSQPLLRAALSDAVPDVRRAALVAFKQVRHLQPESLDAVTRALADDNEDIKMLACEALVEKLGPDPMIVHVLADIVTSPDRSETRAAACNLLGQMGDDAQSTVAMLLDAIQGSDAAVREAALRAVVFIQGPEAFAGFMLGQRDDDPSIRVLASAGWRKAHAIPEQAIPLLIQALHDPEYRVRANVAHALGRVDPLPEAAVAPLMECVRDPHDEVRIHAAVALRAAPSSSALAVALNHLLHDPHPRVRLLAAARMIGDDPLNAEVQAVIRESLANPKAALRTAAFGVIQGLGDRGGPFAADMQQLVDHPDWAEQREQLLTSLAAFSAPAEPIVAAPAPPVESPPVEPIG